MQQQQQQQGLPSISSLTNGLPSSKQQLSPGAQARSEQLRDSGTWLHPHSKRECSLFPCLVVPLSDGSLRLGIAAPCPKLVLMDEVRQSPFSSPDSDGQELESSDGARKAGCVGGRKQPTHSGALELEAFLLRTNFAQPLCTASIVGLQLTSCLQTTQQIVKDCRYTHCSILMILHREAQYQIRPSPLVHPRPLSQRARNCPR